MAHQRETPKERARVAGDESDAEEADAFGVVPGGRHRSRLVGFGLTKASGEKG